MCNMVLNSELNGVELYFDNKPSQEILNNLKGNSFRWSGKKLCWYAKQSPNTLTIAQELSGEANQEQQTVITDSINQTPITRTTKEKNKLLPLYNRIQFTPGTTTKDQYKYKFVGSNYTGLDTKETAK